MSVLFVYSQATGGQDNLLRVWVLKESYAYFDDMRQKYSEGKYYIFEPYWNNSK